MDSVAPQARHDSESNGEAGQARLDKVWAERLGLSRQAGHRQARKDSLDTAPQA